MKKMNALMILAVLLLGLALPDISHCRPMFEEEDEMDNAIEPEGNSRKAEVQDWIKFTKAPPQKYVQKLGESIEVECEIMGSPAPYVEWVDTRYDNDEFESNQINEGSPSAIVRSRKVLKIDRDIEVEHTYTCRGRAGGKVISASTTIYPSPELKQTSSYTEMFNAKIRHKARLAAYKPKIVYSHPLHIDIVGSNIILPCQVVGSPRPQIQWVNSDGYIGEENPRYKVLPTGDLLITSIKWEDMGAYKCIAKNSHGKDSADAFIYPALKE